MAALELKQQLKLSQQLIMTPQLQQAIKLLQLSRLELLETISQELETNPLLEEVQEDVADARELEDDSLSEGEVPAQDSFQEVEVVEKVREDFDWESYLDEYSSGSPVVVETDPNKEWSSFDTRLSLPDSLGDHLAWQLRMSDMTDLEKEIGVHIIGNLNRDGYLDATVEEIAESTGAQAEDVIRVLQKIQVFDPMGVAARDLQECLLVQARNLVPPNDLVVEILSNHLHFLESKNYTALVRALKRSSDEVKQAVEVILRLEPRPGRAFGDDSVEYVSPDLYVLKVDGEYVILLNEDGMPKLRVSSYYKEALSGDQVIPTDAKDFIPGTGSSAADECS